MNATAGSWKHLPAPERRASLDYRQRFGASEAERLRRGQVPESMEDKWFVYFEEGWLRFHRSWTGAFVFAVRLVADGEGMAAVDAWVSRDPEHYTSNDIAGDRALLERLVAMLLRD